jgi:16S rRNA processing protein RimM
MAGKDASGPLGEAAVAAPSVPQDWTWLGRIRRSQGRKGEVFADILTDFPEKFSERRQLWLLAEPSAAKLSSEGGGGFNPRIKQPTATRALAPERNSPTSKTPCEVELLHHWPHKGGIVLHFAGVDSISAAETLKGLIVAIPRAERAALGEDEVYVGDLIGCSLIDVAGAKPVAVGEIEQVDRSAGPVALLVVCGAAGEVLIPFAKSYLRGIDLAAKRVEMALPEGLVGLNMPGK